MGCFSFKCLECGDGVESTSFSGQNVGLYLLKNGVIVQQMHGPYDSYGRVFINGSRDEYGDRKSQQWQNPSPDYNLSSEENDEKAWNRVCDLIFHPDITNGIAAIHKKCFKKLPTHRSPDDPNQGWGGTKHDRKLGPYDPMKDLIK